VIEKDLRNIESVKKVFIKTYGCQMNEYDSEKMIEILASKNYLITKNPTEADLIILNTCSIREKAENKVFSELGRLRKIKSINPNLKIGVGGCVAQQRGSSILKRSRNVDFVFGTDNLFELPGILKKISSDQKICKTDRHLRQKVRNFIPDNALRKTNNFGIKSFIAITKGCNNNCSFCVVPNTRGGEVSREPENIITEAKNLISAGTKEICLLGQNVNSYNANNINFVELLKNLDSLKDLERLRFISPHPKDFKKDLANAFVELRTLCEHMHLPLQAGSNRILKKMRRFYTIETFFEKVNLLRDRLPDATLSTDLIVGFPGETDEEFEMTLEAVKKIRFDSIYSFKYSPRPKTPAAKYPEQIPEEIRSQRLKLLLEAQEKIVQEKNNALVGTNQEILIEKKNAIKGRMVSGRSRGNHLVTIDNCENEVGELIQVKITEIHKNSIKAEPMSRFKL
tara:strand:- start:524 stop:1888 length:1365 start_codon:yes stop_codon:yes gene_type:complete